MCSTKRLIMALEALRADIPNQTNYKAAMAETAENVRFPMMPRYHSSVIMTNVDKR